MSLCCTSLVILSLHHNNTQTCTAVCSPAHSDLYVHDYEANRIKIVQCLIRKLSIHCRVTLSCIYAAELRIRCKNKTFRKEYSHCTHPAFHLWAGQNENPAQHLTWLPLSEWCILDKPVAAASGLEENVWILNVCVITRVQSRSETTCLWVRERWQVITDCSPCSFLFVFSSNVLVTNKLSSSVATICA